jgi:hypothetical protein
MTHYLTYVLVSKDVEDIEQEVFNLLQPYWNDLEVPEYPHECDCVSHSAYRKAVRVTDKIFGRQNETRPRLRLVRAYDELPESNECPEDRDEFLKKKFRELLEIEPPDVDCEECEGTGIVMSTINQSAMWDYYSTGGRWEEILSLAAQHKADIPIPIDFAPVKTLNLEELLIPFVIVTPDGQWSQYDDSWFDSFGLNTHWTETFKGILEDHKDSILVVVDCHQ